jgi:hypothetical protein
VARTRFGNIFETQVFSTVEYGCTHGNGLSEYNFRGYACGRAVVYRYLVMAWS